MACTCDEKDACTCKIVSGLHTVVSGYGTEIEPIRVSITDLVLQVVDTATINITLTGDGDVDTPYFIRMDVKPVAMAAQTLRWVGTEEEYANTYPEEGTIHVVTSPSPRMYGATNLFAGNTPAQKVYAGDVLVAERVGGVLVPPT